MGLLMDGTPNMEAQGMEVQFLDLPEHGYKAIIVTDKQGKIVRERVITQGDIPPGTPIDVIMSLRIKEFVLKAHGLDPEIAINVHADDRRTLREELKKLGVKD